MKLLFWLLIPVIVSLAGYFYHLKTELDYQTNKATLATHLNESLSEDLNLTEQRHKDELKAVSEAFKEKEALNESVNVANEKAVIIYKENKELVKSFNALVDELYKDNK